MQKSNAITEAPEPWMGGRYAELPAIPRLLCCSFELSLRDLRKWIGPLPNDLIWEREFGLESVGFHLRHLAGSVDRLMTYARGEALSEEQLAALQSESEPKGSVDTLLSEIEQTYAAAAEFVRGIPESSLPETRFIGRKRLETPLGVLLGHLAEHTQRHTGQAIVLAKLAARIVDQQQSG